MGDTGDDFNAMRAATQGRHADWKVRNLLALQNTTLIFQQVNRGETLLFRESSKPQAYKDRVQCRLCSLFKRCAVHEGLLLRCPAWEKPRNQKQQSR